MMALDAWMTRDILRYCISSLFVISEGVNVLRTALTLHRILLFPTAASACCSYLRNRSVDSPMMSLTAVEAEICSIFFNNFSSHSQPLPRTLASVPAQTSARPVRQVSSFVLPTPNQRARQYGGCGLAATVALPTIGHPLESCIEFFFLFPVCFFFFFGFSFRLFWSASFVRSPAVSIIACLVSTWWLAGRPGRHFQDSKAPGLGLKE